MENAANKDNGANKDKAAKNEGNTKSGGIHKANSRIQKTIFSLLILSSNII